MKKIISLGAIIGLFLPIAVFAVDIDSIYDRVMNGVLDSDTMAVYLGGEERQKIACKDLDNDGDLDMFLGTWDGRITYFENKGTATVPVFRFVTDFYDSVDVMWGAGCSRGYSSPEFVDLDNDGDFDLVSGDFIGKTHFYRNIGTASSPKFEFVDTLHYGWIRHPCISFADIDNDSDLDMVIGEENGGILHFFENIYGVADSTIWAHIGDTALVWKHITSNYVPDSGMTQVDPEFIDIDNDSDFDLIIGSVNGQLLFWRNDGTVDSAQWTFVTNFYDSITSYNRAGPGFADIDGDGDYDLFMGSRDGLPRFFENVGNADSADFNLITDMYNYLDFGQYSVPAFADIDKDGRIDMYVGTGDGKMHKVRNLGDNNWEYETRHYGDTINVTKNAAPAFADINNNGKLDLFIGKDDGTISLYMNTGTDSFPVWTLVSATYSSIDVGKGSKPTFWDIDKDGDLDLFIGNDSGRVWFYRNDGNPNIPSFTLMTDRYLDTTFVGFTAPAFGDIDLDGKAEMLLGVERIGGTFDSTWGGVYVYRDTSSDSSIAKWELVDTNYLDTDHVGRRNTPTLVDIDGDGDLDLFTGESDGGINFWKNETIPGVEEEQLVDNKQMATLTILRNPFIQSTVISYYLPVKSMVSLKIYDLSGREAKTLVNEEKTAGTYKVNFSAKGFSNGIYFARLTTNGKSEEYTSVKKIILMK